MKMRHAILAIALLFSQVVFAQTKKGKDADSGSSADDANNLVENGSFENVVTKALKSYGQLTELCKPWMTPNETSPDLFATGTKGTKAGCPVNDFGVQEPHSGSGYAGFVAYTKDPKKNRTYVMAKLKSTLVKDKLYCVKFNVSLAELSKYAVNNIGVYFADRELNTKSNNALTFKPNVTEKTNRIIQNMDGWETICGTYIAKGREQFIILGGFGEEDQMKNMKMKKPASATGVVMNSAYYYLDGVEVTLVEASSQCACGAAASRGADLIYSRSRPRTPDMTTQQIINGTGVYFPFLSTEINGMFDEELKEVAAILKADPKIRIELTGHSDLDEVNEGKVNVNDANIALRRAESVRDFFISEGISESRITVVSLDDTSPANNTGTPLGKAQNQRVEIKMK